MKLRILEAQPLILFTLWGASLLSPSAQAQTSVSDGVPSVATGNVESVSHWSRHHCLFVLGLPGDPAHRDEFQKHASNIHQQLNKRGFPRENVTVLTDRPPTESNRMLPVKRETIQQVAKQLVTTLTADDSLWVIFIGHADHDGEHARFHIPGPDLRAIDYADLFEDLRCKQQVFWLTMSSSGWFTEPLSKTGRIVVTATTRDAEPNETEFPSAFATALGSPSADLDRDQDGEVSVLDLFAKTHELVEQGYLANDRAPTEHATIDDNADGKGTEWKEILAEQQRIAQLQNQLNDEAANQSEDFVRSTLRSPIPSSARVDGKAAAATIVPNVEESVSAETADVETESLEQ